MCMKMEEALIEHELHAAPKLFLMEDLDKEQRERVKVRIKTANERAKFGGQWVSLSVYVISLAWLSMSGCWAG